MFSLVNGLPAIARVPGVVGVLDVAFVPAVAGVPDVAGVFVLLVPLLILASLV
jgi:hypothetical protein